VKLGSKRDQGWLDSLARWSAGGRKGGAEDLQVLAGGTTRRTVLRTAAATAGVAAFTRPFGFLAPASATAATTQQAECARDSFAKVYEDFQACVKDPLEIYEAASNSLAKAEDLLLSEKRPSVRRRLLRIIDRESKTRGRTLKDLEFCNAAFAQDRGVGEAKCQAEFPPPGAGGGGGGGGSVGCEPGFLLCGSNCCEVANAFCQGCNGTLTCCRNGGNCCPSSSPV
jgi:hypothetical protein